MCTRLKLVPFVLCTMGVILCALNGCKKEAEPPQQQAAPSHSPESYMKDPAFRGVIAEKRKALMAIAAERKPLMDRMEALVRSHRSDLAALQKLPEWKELHKKVVALNEKYEALKREQLKIVKGRITPTKPAAPAKQAK